MSKISNIYQTIKEKWYYQLLISIFVLIVIVVIFDKLIMPWYVNLGYETELPDVVELSVEEAGSLLKKSGFSVILSDSVYDPNLAMGFVVEQSPYPFAKVKKGRHIYLTVSIGKKPIIMPNLFYKSPRDAELILKSYGLELRSKFYDYNPIAVEGVVVGQSYPQGQKIKKGSKINITISLGPFPEQKVIPALVGKSLQSARKQLRALGVKSINVTREEREDLVPNTVLEQSLKSGTAIVSEMEIELKVSSLKSGN